MKRIYAGHGGLLDLPAPASLSLFTEVRLTKGCLEAFNDGVIAIITLAHRWPAASGALSVLVAILWLVPDPRFERALAEGRSA